MFGHVGESKKKRNRKQEETTLVRKTIRSRRMTAIQDDRETLIHLHIRFLFDLCYLSSRYYRLWSKKARKKPFNPSAKAYTSSFSCFSVSRSVLLGFKLGFWLIVWEGLGQTRLAKIPKLGHYRCTCGYATKKS